MTFNKNVLLGLVAVFTLTYAHGAGQTDRQINAEKIKNGSGILTLPTSTDTLVGRATTDTLTNKSISGSTNTLSAIPRASVAAGTASHVLINDGSGNLSSEAILTKSRGGVGYDLTTQAAELPEIATPSTPASGFGRVYFKSDGKLYQINDAGTETQVGSGSGGGGIFAGGQNLISNNSFEENTTGCTASGGTFQRETGAANLVPPGVAGASWDPSASSETLSFTATTITSNDGISGRNGVLSCAVKTTATDLKMQAYDGTNVLSPNSATDVVPSSSAGFVRYSVNFIFPSSGTVQARFLSQSNSSIAYIDDCYMGLAEGFNVSNVSQAQFIGSAYIDSTSCTPSRTSATLGALTDDTDCPGPTVELNPGPGTIQTTDANNYEYTVNNLPPGNYVVLMTGAFVVANAVDAEFAISDGTTTTGYIGADSGSANWPGMASVKGAFRYTSAGNRTFEFFVKSTSGAIAGQDGSKSSFMIYRFPLESEQAYRADTQPAIATAYHDNDCGGFSTTSTSYTTLSDASCTFTQVLNNGLTLSSVAGINSATSFTPPSTGIYEITGQVSVTNNTSGQACGVRMIDGSSNVLDDAYITEDLAGDATESRASMIGYLNVTSISAQTITLQMDATGGTCAFKTSSDPLARTIHWKVKKITQSIPAPVLVGSITSQSTGAERIERAIITNGGTPAVSSQSGSWISSLTDNGTGDTTVNIAAGIFSGTPACVCVTYGSGDAQCSIKNTTAASSTVMRIQTGISDGTDADFDFHIHCMGPR